jgi:GNAT superfamily N-acetyltransferase
MPTYSVRRATLEDLDVLVHQRIRMCEDIGTLSLPGADRASFAREYRAWLADLMPAGTYVSWLVDHETGDGARASVAGGGATIIPWPPGPTYRGRQLAYVYNVYTEPEHRGRGLARRVMDAIHAFCRDRGIESVGLNASSFGQPLYESMGYHVTPSPMMFLSLKERAV